MRHLGATRVLFRCHQNEDADCGAGGVHRSLGLLDEDSEVGRKKPDLGQTRVAQLVWCDDRIPPVCGPVHVCFATVCLALDNDAMVAPQ